MKNIKELRLRTSLQIQPDKDMHEDEMKRSIESLKVIGKRQGKVKLKGDDDYMMIRNLTTGNRVKTLNITPIKLFGKKGRKKTEV